MLGKIIQYQFLNSHGHIKRGDQDIPCLLYNFYVIENKITNGTTSGYFTFVVNAFLCFIL